VLYGKGGERLQHAAHVGGAVAVDLSHVGRDRIDGDHGHVANFGDLVAEQVEVALQREAAVAVLGADGVEDPYAVEVGVGRFEARAQGVAGGIFGGQDHAVGERRAAYVGPY
jgi:hypothetical protein